MGSFANAMLCGLKAAELLLSGWNPFEHTVLLGQWHAFVNKILQRLSKEMLGRVEIRKLDGPFTIKYDDTMPVVMQLRQKDGSETHVITVCNGNMYDAASSFMLHKTEVMLKWCCGVYGYNKTLRAYILVVGKKRKTMRPPPPRKDDGSMSEFKGGRVPKMNVIHNFI
jgi:hypothetical protein